MSGNVAIFGPHPLLTITIEKRPTAGDEIHVHPGGQGVWVSRMAGELGAHPIMCGFIGGETGTMLEPLLDQLPGERRLVRSTAASGCYVQDRRNGERALVSGAWSDNPSRHELDDLFSLTVAAALESDVLVICNPVPPDVLPLEFYCNLAVDVRANGTPVLVDLSSPRLDSVLPAQPDLVKLNDWELAGFVQGPVSEPADLRAAAGRIRDAGAGTVVVTRGAAPALVLRGGEAWELVPPRFDRGAREGCGDSMMGGVSAAWAEGRDWQMSLRRGAAAGAANFLRHGLGTGSREVVEELVSDVELRPL